MQCDETKPTCNQCAKARRQCPGYRDEFDLVLRNENLAAKRRALKINTGRRKNSKNSRKSSSPASSSAPTSDTASTSSSSSSSSSPSPEAHHHPRRPASNTSTKPLPIYPLNNKQQQQRHLPIAVASIPPPISLSPEDLAPCHFLANFVLLPRHDGTRGFMEFLLPLLSSSSSSSSPPPPPPPQPQTQPPTPPTRTRTLALALSPGAGEADYYHHYQELLLQQQHQEQLQLQLQQQQQRQQQRQQQQQQQQDLPLRHAFNACALAWWGNRFGGGSAAGGSAAVVAAGGVVGGGGDGVLGRAFAEYARALRAVQVALRDPAGCRSDGVLAAVLLLGMFEVSAFFFLLLQIRGARD